jgi:siroheme synthase-like protein
MPVDLLIEGRHCLVVGGGNVATRKVGHLLEAGARVKVVSTTMSDTLAAWAKDGKVTHMARKFRIGDLRGQFLVFAATDDEAVNRHVVSCCRKRGILCNAADANWTEGDFLTPAILRNAGLVVTVSTGGRSCRMARIIKDRLAQTIENIAADPGR